MQMINRSWLLLKANSLTFPHLDTTSFLSGSCKVVVGPPADTSSVNECLFNRTESYSEDQCDSFIYSDVELEYDPVETLGDPITAHECQNSMNIFRFLQPLWFEFSSHRHQTSCSLFSNVTSSESLIARSWTIVGSKSPSFQECHHQISTITATTTTASKSSTFINRTTNIITSTPTTITITSSTLYTIKTITTTSTSHNYSTTVAVTTILANLTESAGNWKLERKKWTYYILSVFSLINIENNWYWIFSLVFGILLTLVLCAKIFQYLFPYSRFTIIYCSFH